MSSTHRCSPWRVPGSIWPIPVPMAIEQAEPGGVSCTTRNSGPIVVVDLEAEAHLVDVERLGAVDVADRDDDQFECPVHGSSLLVAIGRVWPICEV